MTYNGRYAIKPNQYDTYQAGISDVRSCKREENIHVASLSIVKILDEISSLNKTSVWWGLHTEGTDLSLEAKLTKKNWPDYMHRILRFYIVCQGNLSLFFQ